MLRKWLLGIVGGLLASTFAHASAYQAGVQYDVVADHATPKAEVREFFSFYCPHCFHFEPLVLNLEASLPKGVTLEKNHVDFLRQAPASVQMMLAQAYVTGRDMGQGHEVAKIIFEYIHKDRANFNSYDDIRSLMAVSGIDMTKFEQKFNSMPVIAAANYMKEQQTLWSEKQVLTGVPTLIVNGKYRVNLAKLDSNNLANDLNQLVAFLLTNP